MRRIFVICTLLAIIGLLTIPDRTKPDAGGAERQQTRSDALSAPIDSVRVTEVVAYTKSVGLDQSTSVQTTTGTSGKKRGSGSGLKNLLSLR